MTENQYFNCFFFQVPPEGLSSLFLRNSRKCFQFSPAFDGGRQDFRGPSNSKSLNSKKVCFIV